MLDGLFDALGLKRRQAPQANEKRDDGFVLAVILPAESETTAPADGNCGSDGGGGGAGDAGGGGADGY